MLVLVELAEGRGGEEDKDFGLEFWGVLCGWESSFLRRRGVVWEKRRGMFGWKSSKPFENIFRTVHVNSGSCNISRSRSELYRSGINAVSRGVLTSGFAQIFAKRNSLREVRSLLF